ncbi:MAG: alpha/beta hydrolase family protein, partial [Clostridia bacterium]
RFIWFASLGGKMTLLASDLDGRTTSLLTHAAVPTVGPDGVNGAGLAFLPDRPAEVCRFNLQTGAITVVTDLNPWLRERRPVPTPKLVTLHTVDGPVENWVWEPAGDGPHPTLIFFHGGPHGAVGPYFQSLIAMPVTQGYAVAAPNFRGSGGYGQEFANLVHANWGPKEGEDGAALIEHLIDTGVAARGRVGVYGGSYGGFMSNWMVTRHPDAQQAAVTIATVSHLATLAYGIDHWESIQTDMGGPPWAIPEYYREHSPITHVDRVQCPVLILHGSDDRTCPPYEAEMWFVALRWQKKTVTWVEYPGEGHVSLFFSGRLNTLTDLHRRTLSWFDQYLKTPSHA